MVFIETPVFTRQVQELLSDEAYAAFQLALNSRGGRGHPGNGRIAQGRWSVPGAGKRGGVRVIYFHVAAQTQVRLLLICRKGVKDDLTAAEKKTLRELNQDW